MIRKVVGIAWVISLVLCLVTLGLWGRSRFRSDVLRWGFGGGFDQSSWRVRSTTRSVAIERLHWYFTNDDYPGDFRIYHGPLFRAVSGSLPDRSFPLAHEFLGFGWEHEHEVSGEANLAFVQDADRFRAPFWPVAPLLGILAFTLIRRWRSWRKQGRSARGLCPVCGYDIRARKDRCTECGTLLIPG